jgi:hypothetical protein
MPRETTKEEAAAVEKYFIRVPSRVRRRSRRSASRRVCINWCPRGDLNSCPWLSIWML